MAYTVVGLSPDLRIAERTPASSISFALQDQRRPSFPVFQIHGSENPACSDPRPAPSGEAWHFLLSKELKLRAKEPSSWLDLPAMMRIVVTTPNVFKHKRPEWLGPFNFFLFPLLSEEFGGYPAGFDKSNFVFITPYESERKKWKSLKGVNLEDGQSYQISMWPTPNQVKVMPESLRIILRKYLGKPEVKSLAPDGTPCLGTTKGFYKGRRSVPGR